MLQIQRLGLFLFGNIFMVMSVIGYQKSIAETLLYYADATTGGWHQMAVSVLCFVAGNVFIITGARMQMKKKEVIPRVLTESLPDKLD